MFGLPSKTEEGPATEREAAAAGEASSAPSVPSPPPVVPQAPQLVIETVGHIRSEIGYLVAGDVDHFDQRWKNKSEAVITHGYVVDACGPNAHELIDRHSENWPIEELADGCTWRAALPNITFANLIWDRIKKDIARDELTEDTVEMFPTGASQLKAKDACRSGSVGLINELYGDVLIAMKAKGATVQLARDAEGVVKEVRFRLL